MKRFHRSLFWKLFLILSAIGLVVLAIPPAYFRLSDEMGGRQVGPPRNEAALVAQLAVDLVGIPPDSSVARRLAAEHGPRISAYGEELLLPGFETSLPPDTLRRSDPRARESGGVTLLFLEGEHMALVDRLPYRFVVRLPHPPMPNHPNLLPLLGLIAFVLGAGFFAIYRLLKPLKSLSVGVERVGGGDLGHRVPETGNDELGDLARSFNRMTNRIREMISAKEQLLLDVSHELRSPLARIKVAMEIPGEAARETIGESARELEFMVSELLESSRLESGQGVLKLESCPVLDLLLPPCDAFFERPPGLTLDRPSKELRVLVDATRMQIALRNVIENALKFSAEQARPVEIFAESDGHRVVIHVCDHGPGVPADCREAVFEPFYRVDKARIREAGGYGLGLSLCRKIVEAHGGSITLGEAPGGGTDALITLPRA